MAAPSAITFFNLFRKWLGDSTFDLDANAFKASLHTSSFVPNVATQSVYADLTNEVSAGNGYPAGGFSLAGITWTQVGAQVFFDATDLSIVGTGAGFTARYLVLRAVGTLNGHVDPLVGYMLLDSAPADVTFASGNPINVVWDASGIFKQT